MRLSSQVVKESIAFFEARELVADDAVERAAD